MRSIVVYFSQTGNTRKVARAMQQAIKEAAGQCDIVKMDDTGFAGLAKYDLIGLGCPTFAYLEPVNVSRFIRKLGNFKGKHSFIFSTHGGHPGSIFYSLAAKLRRHGLRVLGGFNCDGSDHMPHYTYPWFTEGHPDEIDLKDAADFARRMVELSRRLSRGERVPMPRFPRFVGGEKYLAVTQTNRPISRGFYYNMTLDRKKCRYPRCRLCVDNCPVKAIDLSVDPLVFRKGCISCWFCEFICPTGAIEVNAGDVAALRQERIESMLARDYPEFFEKAKKELIGNRSTLYRPLRGKTKIGNIDTFYGEAYLHRRPRFVIREDK